FSFTDTSTTEFYTLSLHGALPISNITYIIEWEPTYINFSVISSDGSIISNWNYTNESEIPHVESTICQYFGTVANFTPQNEQPKDRKSTRLNSSHVKISYAVFCLK